MKYLTRLARLSAPALLVAMLALPAAAQNYCNNPVPPCDPNSPASPCYKPPDPPPKCEPLVCGKCTKSPCYVGSGVYAYDERDLEIPTTGFPIAVTRLYQSTHAIDGESGYGWTSSLSARLYYAVYLKSAPSTYQKEADVRLPSGTMYRFVENANGSFTPPEGRADTLVHNADGTWDFWIQRTRSRYSFSATGNLVAMIDDAGNTQTWTYVDDRLTHIEDTSGSGRNVDITYGADGRISDVTDMTGRNVHYAYNGTGNMISMTNAAGQVTTYTYTAGKYVPLLTRVNDPWNRVITTVVYDAQDRVRSYTERGETFTYTYAYNGDPAITAKADSGGNSWQHVFSPGGLVTESRPPGGGTPAKTTYDAHGRPLLETDQAGVKKLYTYNADGNPLTITSDYQGPTPVEWRYTYAAGFPEKIASVVPYDPATNAVHPHWQGMKFDYHPNGSNAPGALHNVYLLNNDGVTTRLRASYEYDTHGRITTETSGAGEVTTYVYDSSGNLTSVTTPSNNDAGTLPVVQYTYDALGRVLTETNADGHATVYTWDVLDRVKTVTLPKPTPSSPLNFVTTYFYDEFDSPSQLLFVRTVDANNRATRVGYDAFGQVLQNIDPSGNILRSVYTNGLLSSQIDENGNITTYAYTNLKQLWTVTSPDGTFERYTYNGDGTVASKRDRAGQTVTFAYDHYKRPTQKAFPGGTSITQTYSGQKLASVVDTSVSPTETHTFTYDSSFRVATNAQGSRGTLSFTYNSEDQIVTSAVTGGATSSYAYYPDGSVRTITWSPVSGNFKYDYTLAGRTQAITFPNSQTRGYTYDDQGRLTQVANSSPTAGTFATFAYGYDVDPFTGLASLLGIRTSITANVPSLSLTNAVTNLGYDNRYLLNRTDYPSGTAYSGLTTAWSYDAGANRIGSVENGVSSTYNYFKYASNPLNSPRLQSDGSNAYTYDAPGNVATRSGTRGNYTFTYDLENRLRTVAGDSTADYRYDYAGRRTNVTAGGSTSTYLYAGEQIVAESGTSPAEYLFGPGIDQALAMVRGGQIYYYSVDGADSVVTLNDNAGSVQNSYAWDIWGALRSQTTNVVNPVGYTSREFSQAGLLYYRFRQYEPSSGRFTGEDPLQEWIPIAGSELYAYVKSSPLMYTDPYGLECFTWSSRGPWRNTGEWGMGESLEFLFMRELPYIPRIPFVPAGRPGMFFGSRGGRIPLYGSMQYFCYWARYLVVTSVWQRTVTVSYFCTCPPYHGSYSYEEQKEFTRKKYLGTYQTHSVHIPCTNKKPF